jgi:hypothetical protein
MRVDNGGLRSVFLLFVLLMGVVRSEGGLGEEVNQLEKTLDRPQTLETDTEHKRSVEPDTRGKRKHR